MRKAYHYTRELIEQRLLPVRMTKKATKYLGCFYSQQHYIVQMDITYDCDFRCSWCNRGCTQAPSKEHISLDQIKKFIKESIEQNRKWHLLRIMGGEPTLHPNLFEILDLLVKYKKEYSPKTILRLETNGVNKESKKRIFDRLPPEIEVYSTEKTTPLPKHFVKANIAPVDFPELSSFDFSNACRNKQHCGIGFTPFGFYQCGTAGAIDRVFGFDIGRKTLPKKDDMLNDLSKKLCRYCGFFIDFNHIKLKIEEEISNTWKNTFKDYKDKKPHLKLY